MSVSLLHPELSHFDLSIHINQSIPISTISRHAIELNWKLLDVLFLIDLHWNWNQPTTHNPPCCLENSALPGKIVRTCHIKFRSAMLIPQTSDHLASSTVCFSAVVLSSIRSLGYREQLLIFDQSSCFS